MKTLLESSVSSLLRFALSAFAGWVTATSGYEFISGDPTGLTVFQLVTGLVLVGLVVLLKYLDGTKYGALGRLFIGSRVLSISASLSRLVVVGISAALAALAGNGAFDTLEPGLSDDPVVSLVVLLCGFAYDRVSKALAP
jgi:hypothetical protein